MCLQYGANGRYGVNSTYVPSISCRIKVNSTQREASEQEREWDRNGIFGVYILSYSLRQNSFWAQASD